MFDDNFDIEHLVWFFLILVATWVELGSFTQPNTTKMSRHRHLQNMDYDDGARACLCLFAMGPFTGIDCGTYFSQMTTMMMATTMILMKVIFQLFHNFYERGLYA